MEKNYLYLLEFFVETISFSATSSEIPLPYEVVISGSVGKSIKVDVFTVQNSISENDPQKALDLNCGRSVLFASEPSEFLQMISVSPFIISVLVKNKNVGEVQIGWTKDFYNLLKKSYNDFADLTPAVMQDQFLYQEKGTDRIMGDIKASVRLTCFGSNLLTSYQMVNTKTDNRKKYVVRGAKGETTFECQKLNEGYSSEVLPLTTLFMESEENRNPLKTIFESSKTPTAAMERNIEEGSLMFPLDNERMSIMALFKSAIDPKFSVRPEEFNLALSSTVPNNASTITFDIVSLMERPEENKYIDFRIKGGSQGLIFEFDTNVYKSDDFKNSEESGIASSTPKELTAENINKMLCKNKDCPAAKKFKDLGIGPLAKTHGLGGIYEQPSLPLTYGLSQTYGVFDEYGPYGLFSRPKRPSSPFIAKHECDWTASCWKPKRCKKDDKHTCNCQKQRYNVCGCKQDASPLRLTGGGVLVCEDFESCVLECGEVTEQSDHIQDNCCQNLEVPDFDFESPLQEHQQMMDRLDFIEYTKSLPLRLTGGGGNAVINYDDVKSPFHECKEVLDQMDEVLYKYKKALGPCGKTTCPFAPNVTKESCKKLCNHEMNVYSISNLAEPSPPPSVSSGKHTYKGAACGSPKCAYAKYKLGLTDEDADIELQHLPAPASGKCGHPKCPSAFDKDLPPIHWDCPDPLPMGVCKNPHCPYLPKEIKCLNAVLAKGPCGNFNCPFAPPDPCDSPYCPFQGKDCPFQKDKEENVCDSPDCPYNKQPEHNCGNPYCPNASQPPFCFMPPCGDGVCAPPYCPGVMNPYLQSLLTYYALMQNSDTIQVCMGGAPCQAAQEENGCQKPVTKKASPCYVPAEAECSYPNCPHMKKMRKGQGPEECMERCDDVTKSQDDEECMEGCDDVSPAEGQGEDEQRNSCSLPEASQAASEQEEICENPDCPFNPKPASCYRPSEKADPCGNPDCPYAPPANPCNVPFPPCMNPLQALLSCLPISICPDGTCPYGPEKTLRLCFGGPGCPLEKGGNQPPKITEEQSTKDDDMCANPSCPYADENNGTEEMGEGPLQAEHVVDERTEVDNAPCSQKTCKSTGGGLVCSECPCGEEGVGVKKLKIQGLSASAPAVGGAAGKRKKRKAKSKYVYSIGDKYPGVQIGHKECCMPGSNVPPKMGWLWNVETVGLKPRRGWRPGALTKIIAERIRKHRESQGIEQLNMKNRQLMTIGLSAAHPSGVSVHIQPKPTLHIKKQDGCYWITMNPLKDPHTLVENESPYMDCTPLQFKIMKNKDKEKQGGGGGGTDEYRSCFCGDDEDGISSSSDSELEIEFTPPAGIIHPERFKKKKNVVHCDTQYMPSDFEKKKSHTEVDKKKKGKKGKGKGKKGKKEKKGKKK